MSTPATGSAAVERHFIDYFSEMVMDLAQQKVSKLVPYVMQESVTGEIASIGQQYGEVEGQVVGSRFGDTPENHVERERRWVVPVDFDIATPIDKFDMLRLNHDTINPIARAQASEIGRFMDRLIIEGLLGTNKTGQDGSTSTAFDTSNQVIAAGATGLTVAKLRQTREIFLKNDIDLDGVTIPMVISPDQLTSLLTETEVTSSDYNSVKALVNGAVDTFMGFKFIVSTRIPGAGNYKAVKQTITPGTGEDYAIAWIPDGAAIGMWKNQVTDIYQRRDKRSNWEAYTCITMGATRMQEEKVVRIATV